MATKTDTAPFEPSGLVFDCDGTLVDTMFFYWHSWEVICEKYGIKFDMKRFFSFAGVPVRDIYQTLIDEQFTDGRPKPDLDQLLEEKHEIVQRRYLSWLTKADIIIGWISILTFQPSSTEDGNQILCKAANSQNYFCFISHFAA